jgi:hypothetical protein
MAKRTTHRSTASKKLYSVKHWKKWCDDGAKAIKRKLKAKAPK